MHRTLQPKSTNALPWSMSPRRRRHLLPTSHNPCPRRDAVRRQRPAALRSILASRLRRPRLHPPLLLQPLLHLPAQLRSMCRHRRPLAPLLPFRPHSHQPLVAIRITSLPPSPSSPPLTSFAHSVCAVAGSRPRSGWQRGPQNPSPSRRYFPVYIATAITGSMRIVRTTGGMRLFARERCLCVFNSNPARLL